MQLLCNAVVTWAPIRKIRTVAGRVATLSALACILFLISHPAAGAAPMLSQFAPGSGLIGSQVLLIGSGFSDATDVSFNGTPAAFTVIADGYLTAVVPAGAVTGPVSVTSPEGTAIGANFTVITPPVISSVSPAQGAVGATVTISGSYFATATGVAFNGTVATIDSVADTQITARVPVGATTGPITVTSPDGTGASPMPFTVISPLNVTGFSPTAAMPGKPVAIQGTGFLNATSVLFNGLAAAFTVYSDSYLVTTVPAGAMTGPLVVSSASGQAIGGTFTIIVPPPTITAFTPETGPEGTSVAITGTGLTYVTAVAFNGASATFAINSDTKITAVVPVGATDGTITVTSSGGTAVSSDSFTLSAPTVATAASATPSPVTGKTTALSVLGAYAGGEAALTYTWSETSGPAAATFSVNATHAARQATATFTQAGTYQFLATIASPSGKTATSSVTVVVNQTPTIVAVTPGTPTVPITGTQAFSATATDQFGSAISGATFTWSCMGAGSIGTTTGAFLAGTVPGTATVTARTGAASGTATVAVSDVAPTLSPITVTSNPVTGTTASLAVTGNYVGGGMLTYHWDTVAAPTGGVATFTGGTTGMPGSAVTAMSAFTKAGSYTARVTVTEANGGTASQTVVVTVSQTATLVVVTPATVSLTLQGTQQFIAQENDQFGDPLAMQPGFTWHLDSGVGSVNSSGLYTASGTVGSAVVSATPSDGLMDATATITVKNSPPTVAQPAAANGVAGSLTTTGTSVALTVLGMYAGGESGLTYAWTVTGGTGVAFSANGTNAAKQTTATFAAPNAYTFTVTITDPTGAQITSSVAVAVNQGLTSITVMPNPDAEMIGTGTRQFTALAADQFGKPLGTQPSFAWSKTGVGTLNASTGNYAAGGVPGTATVTASIGGVSGSAAVTVSDVAPTLGKITVTPSPVMGTTGTLSVTGTYTGAGVLTYAWTTTMTPAGGMATFTGGTTGASGVPVTADATFSQPGTYNILVTVMDAAGTAVPGMASVVVIAAPTISSFSPASGPIGTSVTITGTYFANASAVTFGGVAAGSYTVVSSTQILATVPSGAKTGVIAVTTPGGTATTATSFTVFPAPTISTFSPGSGIVGITVTITGSGMTGATSVTFGGAPAGTYVVNSDTSITAVVPAAAVTGAITVTALGGTVTSASSFTVIPTPVITGFSPTSGAIGTTVTLTGTGLMNASSVAFGGVSAATFTSGSSTSILVKVPAGALTGVIAVTTPGGTVSSPGVFTVFPIPTISGFSPASGPVGTSVTISGTGLTNASNVTFGGQQAVAVTVNSDTSVAATVPAGALTGVIAVTTPGGTALSASSFTVVPAPTITGFSPASGVVGTAVALTGSHLTGATGVSFGGTPAVTFVVNSSASITAVVPSGAATGAISVTTPGGLISSTASFTVIVAPAITSFTPVAGNAGTSVALTGSGFTGTTSVAFNGVSAPFTVNASNSLTATAPAGVSTGIISVTNPAGTANSSSPFTVIAPPTITSFSPASGVIGVSVTILGTGFTGATGVAFGGAPSVTFVVSSSTAIMAIVPAGAMTGLITVTAPGGVATSASSFFVGSSPAITGFSPASGVMGQTVTITGTNLSGATRVAFNGAVATITGDSSTQITVTVPSGAATGTVAVTTPAGTATSSTAFTVLTWSAVDVAADPDGTAKVLADRSDGAATVWLFSGANVLMMADTVFGPYFDSQGTWMAKAIKTAGDGTARILWTRSDGAAGLWSLNAGGTVTTVGPTYGPTSDSHGTWAATGLAADADGTSRVLWTRSDGGASVWSMSAADVQTNSGPVYGPYGSGQSFWHASGIAAGDSGTSRLLWTRADGAAGVWSVSAAGMQTTVGPIYGPYTTPQGVWHAMNVGASPDGTAHVLWMRADGAVGLWAFNALDAETNEGSIYGPYAGFSAQALNTVNDQSRVLWVRSDRAAGLWTFNASDLETLVGSVYGPF